VEENPRLANVLQTIALTAYKNRKSRLAILTAFYRPKSTGKTISSTSFPARTELMCMPKVCIISYSLPWQACNQYVLVLSWYDAQLVVSRSQVQILPRPSLQHNTHIWYTILYSYTMLYSFPLQSSTRACSCPDGMLHHFASYDPQLNSCHGNHYNIILSLGFTHQFNALCLTRACTPFPTYAGLTPLPTYPHLRTEACNVPSPAYWSLRTLEMVWRMVWRLRIHPTLTPPLEHQFCLRFDVGVS
jgi:hypothetical protein